MTDVLSLPNLPTTYLKHAKTELATRKLKHFIPQAWHIVEPFTEFKMNWHIEMITEHLEYVDSGDIRNLLVTMPPRMMKSITISVMYPAWHWIHDPGMRYMYASYSGELAMAHSLATRRIIEDEWYQERWGDIVKLSEDMNAKGRFENTMRGARFSTSVKGVTTGMGGNRLVVDDPHNVLQAESDTEREASITWWDQAMSTRFNDPKKGARIIVMQRVHEKDLAGHVIEQGGYVHLNLPMEYEPKSYVYTGFGQRDPRTEEGELLFPERSGREEVEDLKVRLGSRAAAGQLQQRPAPAEGNIIKADWLAKRWGTWVPQFDWIIQTWDTAFKEGQENDYAACLTCGLAGGVLFALDLWHDKAEFPKLKRAVVDNWRKWYPDEIVIEDKASGQSLIQEFKDTQDNGVFLPIIAFNPGSRDKVERVNTISPFLEGGRFVLPEDADWVNGFVHECVTFPNAEHDDRVDVLSMTVLRISKNMRAIRPLSPEMLKALGLLTPGEPVGMSWAT